jgi:hypothetical protein
MVWLLTGSALILILSLVAVSLAMMGDTVQPAAAATAAATTQDPVAPTDDEPDDAQNVPDTAESSSISDHEFLRLAEPLARQFLNATSIDDLLPLLREPARVEPRLRAYYHDDRIIPDGLNIFNTRGNVERQGSFLSINIQTDSSGEKIMSFFNAEDGLKIDWESWVGWSAMPWQDFLTKKPSSPTLFRVTLRKVDYYNFGFSDEGKWRSYRLDSPDGLHMLYGYVERGSLTDSMIHLPPEFNTTRLTLMLSFPEEPGSGNQVRIDRLATDGWLIEKEEPQS